jgi:putative ABC transport system permease protein
MGQSVRERVPEFAVLRALGFNELTVIALVLAESLLVCIVAASIGIYLARALFGAATATLGPVEMPAAVLISGFGAALLLALASGIPPALRAKKLNVVEALARRR